jgi:alcohol dehydrogenase class IV
MKINLENIVGQASQYSESLCLGNTRSLREAYPTISRLEEFALMTGGETAEDGINWLAGLCRDLMVPPLSALGITEADFPAIVEKSKNSSSMKGNPIELTELELTQVLHHAL